jgi:hypothetical protein
MPDFSHWMSGSYHSNRASNVEIGVECQIIGQIQGIIRDHF